MAGQHLDARIWAEHGILHRRGLVGDVVGDVVGSPPGPAANAAAKPPDPPSDPADDPPDGGGVGGILTSVVGGATSVVVGGVTSVIDGSTGLLPTASPSNSKGATNTGKTSTTLTSTSTNSTSSTSTSTTSTPTSSSTSTQTFTQIVSGTQSTVTVQSAQATTPTASSSPAPKGFLENKPLATGIFTVVGLLGLALLVLIVACAFRRSRRIRRDREFAEAVSFDPSTTDRVADLEKRSLERWPTQSSGNGLSVAHGTGAGAGDHFFGTGQGFGHPAAFMGAGPYGGYDTASPYAGYDTRAYQQYSPPSAMHTAASSPSAEDSLGRTPTTYTKSSGMTMPVSEPLPDTFGDPAPGPPALGEIGRNESAHETPLAQPRNLMVANE